MDYTLNFTPWNPISSRRCTLCWPRVARFFWPTVLAWRKWDEVEGSGTGRAQGGREKKGGWGFKKSWASDADGEWKRLPWKPGPASSESMSKWGEGERSKWMDGWKKVSFWLEVFDLLNLLHKDWQNNMQAGKQAHEQHVFLFFMTRIKK